MSTTSGAHRDRIAQAYLGGWGDTFTQEKSRRRIDWLVSQVVGERILDIGCSEGILAVLLGRKGAQITAIDVNQEAIEYAESLIEGETSKVRKNIKFLCRDVLTLDLSEQSFSTVILGQFLEHFSQPDKLVKQAVRYLEEGGTLLVTTPYGQLPDKAHKYTFDLESFLSLFSSEFNPKSLDIVDGNIRFSAVLERPDPATWSEYSRGWIARLIERNHLDEQDRLYTRIEKLQESLELANSIYRKVGTDFIGLQDRLSQTKDESEAAARRELELRNELENANQRVRDLEQDYASIQRNAAKSKRLAQERSGEIVELRQAINKIQRQTESLSDELETLKTTHRILESEHGQVIDYFDDFQRSTVYRSVVEIRRALVSPGFRTFRLPFVLLALALRKARKDLSHAWTARNRTRTRSLENGFATAAKRIEIDLTEWKSESPKLSFIDSNSVDSDLGPEEHGYIRLLPTASPPNLRIGVTYKFILKGENQSATLVQLFIVEQLNGERRAQYSSINTPMYFEPSQSQDPIIKVRVRGGGRVSLNSISVSAETSPAPPIVSTVLDRLRDVKVACILDPFSMQCFSPECRLITPTPDNWIEILEQQRPDVLLVESAWEGNGGTWTRRVAQYPGRNAELYAMIRYCNDRGIPTIFWNKEDPVHFDSFIGTARWFDYIFTTDSNSIDRYKEATGNPRVYPLPFAAQPAIHNPIDIYEERSDKIVFTGAYYSTKYDQRKKDLDRLIRICKDHGLEIYDRHFGRKIDEFQYPDHLKEYIVGGLSPNEIHKAYKGYKFALNVNSVKDSPTMFSRRVFELIASNTPVISSYSLGIEQLLGEHVICTDDEGEIRSILAELYGDKESFDLFRLRGLRHVLSQHTYADRLRFMLEAVGFSVNDTGSGVTVIINVESMNEYRRLKELYDRFELENKQLVVLHAGLVIEDEGVTTLNMTHESAEQLQRQVVYDWAAVLSPHDHYGRNYLLDLWLGSKYVDVPVIGKGASYSMKQDALILLNATQEYRHVDHMPLASCIFKADMLTHPRLCEAIANRDFDFEPQTVAKPDSGAFAIDRFNYVKGDGSSIGVKHLEGVVWERENAITGEASVSRFPLEGTQLPAINGSSELYPSDTSGKWLIVTNIYPSERDLYRNAFIHRRVKLYQQRGMQCDVFVLDGSVRQLSPYTFENVQVYKGETEVYHRLVGSTDYQGYLIHFVDSEMIARIDLQEPHKPIIVWLHGVEAEAWHRRLFEYELSVSSIKKVLLRIRQTRKQLRFLSALYENRVRERDIHFVFASKWFKRIAETDAGFVITNASIIPNVIDTKLFRYKKKDPSQRKKILSIRPYESRKYGNDLSVRAVEHLSRKPFFDDLEFCFVGSGSLFDSTLASIRAFPNVRIRETYFPQQEIAELHQSFGIFLCPTRWDAQGVSMGEAMASGLVPVTSEVAAIPEFVDPSSGVLARPGNYKDLADGIEELYYAPEQFLAMSRYASRQISELCGPENTIEKEIELMERVSDSVRSGSLLI